MHRALRIQEILLTIFSHWHPSKTRTTCHSQATAILAALARTCRSFKDVALDILWSELVDLTPLPRCIPEACRVRHDSLYSFKRRLNEKEWATLSSYTRRIWHIHGNSGFKRSFENDSLVMICGVPAGPPLFPNLRTLYWGPESKTMIPAMHVAVPSLTTLELNLKLEDYGGLKHFLDTIGDLCRDMNRVRIRVSQPRPKDLDNIICNHIRRLAHVRELKLKGIAVDVDMIACLSEKSALEHLLIQLDPSAPHFLPHSRSAYMFPALVRLETSSASPASVTSILSCAQFPALKDLEANFDTLPLKETFVPFISAVRKTCSSDSLTSLQICGDDIPDPEMPSGDRLSFNDLHSCTAFTHLRCLILSLPYWTVALTDNDMHALVSAWPHLHTLSINETWGWRNSGGITFRGLAQILNTRRSLVSVCMAIDTASHVDLPSTHEIQYLPLSPSFEINVVDSRAQSHEVSGLVKALRKLGLHDSFVEWDGWAFEEQEMVYPDQIYIWSLVKRGLEGGFRAQ